MKRAVWLWMMCLVTLGKSDPIQWPIWGVKVYPNQPNIRACYRDRESELAEELSELGVNMVFSSAFEGQTAFYPSSELQDQDTIFNLIRFRSSLHAKGIGFAAVCQIFFDPDIIRSRPDYIPIDQWGRNHYTNWQRMVCPTDSAYRAYKLRIIREVLQKLQPDILSLDFIRYPMVWEEVSPATSRDSLREFCFCERCVRLFERQTGIYVPENRKDPHERADWILSHYRMEWTRWKVTRINSWVSEVWGIRQQERPECQLCLHLIPWPDSLLNSARLEVSAQDPTALSEWIDLFSPMIYHKKMGRSIEWIGDIVRETSVMTGKRVVPSIQAQQIGNEGEINGEAFCRLLAHAGSEPSGGWVIFHWGYLMPCGAEDPERMIKCDCLRQLISQP